MKKLSILFAALLATTLSFAATFVKTDLANIKGTDIVIITSTVSGTTYAMSNDNAASKAPAAVAMTITDSKIETNAENILWNITYNDDATFVVTAKGTTNKLYCTNNNNGVRVGAGENNVFNVTSDYIYNVGQKRYLGVYNKADWRCYTTIHDNIKDQTFAFYVKEAGQDVPATAIALDQTTLNLEQYKYVKLAATLTPAEATTEVVWTSSNDKVATVANGLVTIVAAEGTATITATAGTVSATCEVTAKSATVLTCAEAAQKALSVSANNEVLAGGKYVIRGYVTAESPTRGNAEKGIGADFTQYGNYSVWMADAKDGGKVFEAYQVKPVDGKTVAKVGDYVEIVGDLTKYNTTPETVGKQNATIAFLADPTPQPAVSPYCQTEVGHFFAENADPNSYVLLSIGSKNGKTIVRIDQDAAKNSAMFDYLQVTGLATAGADVDAGGEKAMAVEFDTPAADADGNITLEILWSTVAWPGRWMVQNVQVPATAECEHAVLVGPSTALDATVVAPKATKRLINGVLVIEKDGVLYTAQGAKL